MAPAAHLTHLTHLTHLAAAYAGRVALATLAQLALVLGPPLLVAAAMQPVALQGERWAQRLVGPRALWIAVGCAATALHEAGHAALALLFGHRVTRVKWFDFEAADGRRGEVEHAYDPKNPYQRAGRFFIGVAPVVFGVLALALAARLLLGVHASATDAPIARARATSAPLDLARALAAQLLASLHDVGRLAAALDPTRWRTWLFLWVALVGSSAMRLSASDLRSVAGGLWTLASLLLLLNALTLWAGTFATSAALHVARALALCDAALLAAILLQALVGIAALALALGVEAYRGRSRALAGG